MLGTLKCMLVRHGSLVVASREEPPTTNVMGGVRPLDSTLGINQQRQHGGSLEPHICTKSGWNCYGQMEGN